MFSVIFVWIMINSYKNMKHHPIAVSVKFITNCFLTHHGGIVTAHAASQRSPPEGGISKIQLRNFQIYLTGRPVKSFPEIPGKLFPAHLFSFFLFRSPRKCKKQTGFLSHSIVYT